MYLVELALRIAFHFLGVPYSWGGDDPSGGFDCSGFVIEILKSVGILPRGGDWTAQGLYNMFKDNTVSVPKPGCLVFYGSSVNSITHIEFCIDDKFSIGASGGGSDTKSLGDAISQNAYIKIRPLRSNVVAFVNPFLGG